MTRQWQIFQGTGEPHDGIDNLPAPPPWRRFKAQIPEDEVPIATVAMTTGHSFRIMDGKLIDMVNAALHLRRPLFVTGKPGTGKSSLADAVAYELRLGPVLHWPINTKSTLKEALYQYDAVGRLQDASLLPKRKQVEPPSIGKYIRLGSLGTALLPSRRPRVLLIDEIDKSEIDLPNDLLHVLEKGEFEIPELARADASVAAVRTADGHTALIHQGRISCHAFPFILMTSNGEREFPAPFFRRCLRHDFDRPSPEQLRNIVEAHLGKLPETLRTRIDSLIGEFCNPAEHRDLAVDQLLNAIYLTLHHNALFDAKPELLYNTIYRSLNRT